MESKVPTRVAGAPRRRPDEFRFFGPLPSKQWPIERKADDRRYLQPIVQVETKAKQAACSLGYGHNHPMRRSYASPYCAKSKPVMKTVEANHNTSPRLAAASLGYGKKHPSYHTHVDNVAPSEKGATVKKKKIARPVSASSCGPRPKTSSQMIGWHQINPESKVRGWVGPKRVQIRRSSSQSSIHPSPIRRIWNRNSVQSHRENMKQVPLEYKAQLQYRAAGLGYGKNHLTYANYVKTCPVKVVPRPMSASVVRQGTRTNKAFRKAVRPCWR